MRYVATKFLTTACSVALGALSAFGATISTTPMNVVPTFEPVGDGAVSTIVRDNRGVTITIETEKLDPGPHTVWVLIWNDPDACTGNTGLACSPPPFGADPPDSVVLGDSAIVDASGKGNFGFRLNVGDASRVIGGRVQAGLTDSLGAEIHVIIADHGEIIPEMIQEQLSRPGDPGCGGPCPIVQGAGHAPGGQDAVAMQLNAIRELLERVAVRNGLKP